jgi:hypothetical protein
MKPAEQHDWIVELDPKVVLDTYGTAIGVTITSFRSLVQTVRSGEFEQAAEIDSSSNFLKFKLVGLGEAHRETIERQLISDTFRSLVSATYQLMDKLIAIERLFQNFIVGPDVDQFDDANAYVEHRIKLATEEVGRDRKLLAPAKVALFDRLTPFSSTALLEYVELRNILEHRHGTADRDCVLMWKELVPTRNGVPMTAPGDRRFEAGDALGLQLLERERRILANSACNLTETEIHSVHGTLQWTIGPELVGHLFPPEPTSPNCQD